MSSLKNSDAPKVLGLIPARGGSKRVPRKNIRPLAGKPLIAYTIEAAQRAMCLEALLVSTDDEEIAGVCQEYGADVPFLRPSEFATDESLDVGYVRHALEWARETEGVQYDVVVLLRPTSPLRTSMMIDETVRFLFDSDASGVRTVTAVDGIFHPYWMYEIGDDGHPKSLFHRLTDSSLPLPRSQDLPACYRLNGLVDCFRVENLKEVGASLYGSRMRLRRTAAETSFDIDTEFDFRLCERIIEAGGL